MATIEEQLIDAVGLVKEANDIIVQLQTENAALKKKAAEVSETSKASPAAVAAVVDKMASVIVNGKPLIQASNKERFNTGLGKHANVISVLSDVVDRVHQLSAAQSSDAHSLGDTAEKLASVTESGSFAERLAAGRIRA